MSRIDCDAVVVGTGPCGSTVGGLAAGHRRDESIRAPATHLHSRIGGSLGLVADALWRWLPAAGRIGLPEVRATLIGRRVRALEPHAGSTA